VASNYHIEMSPGDAGSYDRYVVQEVIKEIAGSTSLTATIGQDHSAASSLKEGEESGTRKKPGFKVVLLMGVDNLTKQAQAALRRTMEKYTSSCRLILCCNSASKVRASLICKQ
jgi:replication factor C subunit 3/5